MEDRLRTMLEQAVVRGCTFEASPAWHFLFLENTSLLQELLVLVKGVEDRETITDAVVAFSDSSPASAADACAALSRMHSVVQGNGAAFSNALTAFFSEAEADRLKEALGVPAEYICAGALVFGSFEPADSEDIRWDVFSYMK